MEGDLGGEPLPYLRVVPGNDVPIMISREDRASTYWDDPVNRAKGGEIDLRFVNFFDWDNYSDVDYQFYRVLIAGFPSQSHLVGREALLEVSHARVLYEADEAANEYDVGSL